MATPQTTHLDPPFIQVEGVCNFRSVGSYATSFNQALRVKPNLLFRCGEITNITATGAETLSSLNVNKIFDLRAKNETAKFNAPSPALGNIDIVHVPVDQDVNLNHDFLTAFLRGFEIDEHNAFMNFYSQHMENIGPALKAVVRNMVEDPEHPLVIHCTAGKDRTGLLVAIILLLLGVSDAEIVQDYSLTEVGLKPMHHLLAARLAKIEAFRNNPVGALHMASTRAETMIAFIKMINDKHGSMEQYILKKAYLTAEDLKALRETALIKD